LRKISVTRSFIETGRRMLDAAPAGERTALRHGCPATKIRFGA
jgi:hypothetical protein